MSGFRDSQALVTGGGRGIGRALAEGLAARGAWVLVADRDLEAASEVVAGIEGRGGSGEAASLDVSDSAAFTSLVEGLVEQRGRIDWLFNNAGIGMTGEARDMTPDAWDRIIDINLKGVVHGVVAAYPHMVRQGSGHIANTACVAGLVPFPMTSAYCATKHAVVGLSTSLRAEAASLGVGVSVICPGLVATDLFDRIEYFSVDKQAMIDPVMKASITPELCARKVLRGVQRNRAVITVNAHAGIVWWLYRLAPRPFVALTSHFFSRVRRRLRTAATG
ncbi:MAG: SDR family oxidoreductase [Acidobacteriota bacterium]